MLRIYTKPKGQIPDYGKSCALASCQLFQKSRANRSMLETTFLRLSIIASTTEEPVILHAANPTIENFCNRLHRNLINEFSYAWVWGKSASHRKFLTSNQCGRFSTLSLIHSLICYAEPQRCGKDHVLCDEDIVQLVKKVG